MTAGWNHFALNVACNHRDKLPDQRSKTLFTGQCHNVDFYLVVGQPSCLRNGFKCCSVETQRPNTPSFPVKVRRYSSGTPGAKGITHHHILP
jgi:hypothetical protein